VARLRETARGQILGIDSGVLKILFSLETRRVLGVHILGEGATELIHIGQAAMALGGTLDYFVENVFNYPTLAEAYKIAALDAWNRMPRVAEVVPAFAPEGLLSDVPPLPPDTIVGSPPPSYCGEAMLDPPEGRTITASPSA
jgi:NAD(P) transhydrogenase